MKRYTVEITYKVVVEVGANSESEALDRVDNDEDITEFAMQYLSPFNAEVIFAEDIENDLS